MASSATPHGAVPVGSLVSAAYNAKVTHYKIKNAYGTSIFYGDLVKWGDDNPNTTIQKDTGTTACTPIVLGCTNPLAFNYDPLANVDDSSCVSIIIGCMDTTAVNWDVVKNPEYDYCKSPEDFVSETPCQNDQICVTSHGAGWTCNGSCRYQEESTTGYCSNCLEL